MSDQGSNHIGPNMPHTRPYGTESTVSVLQRNPIGLVRATSNHGPTNGSHGPCSNNNQETSITTAVHPELHQVMAQSGALPATITKNKSSTSNNTDTRPNKRKIFLHPLRGAPLKIFITRHTPDREDLKTLIHTHGGSVTEHEKMAYIRLAPPGFRYAEQLYSTEWVRDCIRKGHLIALHEATEYKLRLAHKADKTPFTADDDNLLRRFVAEKTAAGAKTKGKKMYQELADAHPRHSMESWRSRAVKDLKITETPSPYAASKALREQIPTARNSAHAGQQAIHPFLPSSPHPRELVAATAQSLSSSSPIPTRSPAKPSEKDNSSQVISSTPSSPPRSSGQPSTAPVLAPPLGPAEPDVVLSSDLAPAIAISDPTLTLPSAALTEQDDLMIAQGILQRMAPVSPEIQDDNSLEDMGTEPPAGQIVIEDHRELEAELFPENTSSSVEYHELENGLFPEDNLSSGYQNELEDELFPENRSLSEVHSLLETREMPEDDPLRESHLPLGFDSPPQDDSWLEEPALPQEKEFPLSLPPSRSWGSPSKSKASFSNEHNMDKSSPALSQDSSYSEAEAQLPEKFFTSHLREKKQRIPGRPKNIKYGSQSMSTTATSTHEESTTGSPGLTMDEARAGEPFPPSERTLSQIPRNTGSENNTIDVTHVKEEEFGDLGTGVLGTQDYADLQFDGDVGDLSDDDAYVASRILSRQRGLDSRMPSSIVSDSHSDNQADEIYMNRETLDLSQISIKQESQTLAKQDSQETGISSSDKIEQHEDDEDDDDEDEPLVRRRPTLPAASSAPTAPPSTKTAVYTELESEPHSYKVTPATQSTTAQQPQIVPIPQSTSTSPLDVEDGSQAEQETESTPQPSPRNPSVQHESANLRIPQQDPATRLRALPRLSEPRDGQPEGSRNESTSPEPKSAEPETLLPNQTQSVSQPEDTIPKTTIWTPKTTEARETHHAGLGEATNVGAVDVEMPQWKITSPKSNSAEEPPELSTAAHIPGVTEVVEILDDAQTLPKRTKQKMTAAELFYAGRAEMAKLQHGNQNSAGDQGSQVKQDLTQEQLVEYIRFRYKEDVHKLCVLGLLKSIQAVDVLDACSGDYVTAKKLIRKGMTADIQSKFWTGVDDSILLSGDNSRLGELSTKYSLTEMVSRTEYLARSRKEAEHYFGIENSPNTILTPLKRPAPDLRSVSIMTDDEGADSPLKRFSTKSVGSLYSTLESKRRRLDEDDVY